MDSLMLEPTAGGGVRLALILALLVEVCIAGAIRSEDSHQAGAETPASERPRIGLVLSGGGALGSAHVG
ncbi:MAG: hypothetical protein MPN21_27295, partial [Thermoanaerobaculia bacterium]|nr:hypothetical protein [Thermoanaerobaculia bacterium]